MLCGSAVLAVLGVMWQPWFAHNHVPEHALMSGTIEAARLTPDDATLNELGGHHLYPPLPWKDDRQLVAAAEKLLSGRIDLPGFHPATFTLPLDAASMASGETKWQLFVHSLGLPRTMLDAYKANGRIEFLSAAAEYLVAYDVFEGSGWGLNGYLWNDGWSRFVRNDHAVAARVPVLVEFWRLYRRSPNYKSDVGAAVLRMASRAGYLLTQSSRFTFATNHGVMQNLAVCNIGMSFPALPGVDVYCALAFTRLGEQLTFFINEEGFVLEHSPGYQGFSVRLIGIAFRYMTLSKVEIPPTWIRKYEAAKRVYADLRRPDGSHPVFGDTDGGPEEHNLVSTAVDRKGSAGPLTEQSWSPQDPYFIAPVAGYGLWWGGLDAWPDPRRVSQTSIAWSHFQGMGHKHADEMSLSIWAAGISWWANVGYWPYDDGPGRKAAESWEGANAPHLVGESADSARQTHLRYSGRDGPLTVIDLERRGPGDYAVRRQLLHLAQGIWIVIDTSASAKAAVTRTIWTTSPTVRLAAGVGAGTYALTDSLSGHSMQAFFDGAPGTIRNATEGSRVPFAGWLVVGQIVKPAPAIIVERPADGNWTLSTWALSDSTTSKPILAGPPQMQRWRGAEDWEVILPTTSGTISLRRMSGRLGASGYAGRSWTVDLAPGPDISRSRAALRAALAVASKQYGGVDISGAYRLKVTVVLLLALMLGAIALSITKRYRPSWTTSLAVMQVVGWLLLSYYFVAVRANLIWPA